MKLMRHCTCTFQHVAQFMVMKPTDPAALPGGDIDDLFDSLNNGQSLDKKAAAVAVASLADSGREVGATTARLEQSVKTLLDSSKKAQNELQKLLDEDAAAAIEAERLAREAKEEQAAAARAKEEAKLAKAAAAEAEKLAKAAAFEEKIAQRRTSAVDPAVTAAAAKG